MKTNINVDGFNLYYGCLRGTPYRWLDIAKLCSLLLRSHEINCIRYFTARVQARPGAVHSAQNQQTYLRALGTTPNLSIHYGHHLSNPKRLPLVDPPPNGPQSSKNRSFALAPVAHFYRPIRPGPSSASQFPATLSDSQGSITKPVIW